MVRELSPHQIELPPEQSVTPADVARAAGVSLVTVSRALNDSSRVSQVTRERVLETARKLGYRPNPTARALRKGQTNTVAVVFKSGHLFVGFHSEILAGFYSVVHQRQLRVMLTVVAPEEESSPLWVRELMSGGGFDSLILHQELLRGFGHELVRLSMPVILAGLLAEPTAGDTIPMAGFDHAEGILQAVRHLTAIGHERIAYIHDVGPALGPSVRPAAFRAGLAEAGLTAHEPWLVSISPGEGAEGGTRAIHQLFSTAPPWPTAAICASDLVAAGAIEAAQAWGRRVPDDLSVIGYGNAAWTAHFRPSLTTVHQSGWELGCVLGRKLLRLRDNTAEEELVTRLPMQLVVRRSTGSPPARHAGAILENERRPES